MAPLDDPFLSQFTDIPSLLNSFDTPSVLNENLLSESPSPSSTDVSSPSMFTSTTPSPTTKTSTRPAAARNDRQKQRRFKNNAASRVSRAKRRATTNSLFVREKELLKDNARLRIQADEMEREAERLRALLVTKLAN